MKKMILAIVVLIIAMAAILEFRYEFTIDSPVVVKFDRLTGDTWIVNAGVWRKVKDEEPQMQAKREMAQVPLSKAASKAN